jgi:hypothetical protein
MRDRRLGTWFVLLVLSYAGVPGCMSLHCYRPVDVVVQDAETQRPIPSAQTRITYAGTNPSQAPCDSSGMTASNGTAHLRAAPCGDVVVRASAPGYMADEKEVAGETIAAVPVGPLIGPDNRQPIRVVVNLYADPAPSVELLLPRAYHGVIRAEINIQDDMPCRPGQRRFTYEVPENGKVQVAGPALLRRVVPADFAARSSDGTLLSREATGDDIAFWCLRLDPGEVCFFVGTRREYESYRRSYQHEDEAQRRESGGGRGYKGRRHKRGDDDGMPAPVSNSSGPSM